MRTIVGPGRDVASIVLPCWGKVVQVDGVVPFAVVGDDGEPVAAVGAYLRDFTASGNRSGSVRSYAYDLLRWWRFLRAVGVDWDVATPAEGRDFVLWLMQARKPVAGRRTRSAATAGTVNSLTRKQYPGDEYMPRTIRHSNAVVRSFYEFWAEQGLGPVTNPVPVERSVEGRANAHHNPLRRFRPEGRLRFNPKVPKRAPRAMSDEAWGELFAAMASDRDRAIVALAVSTGARASELVRLRPADVDWGDQLIRVRRKGTDAEQWLAGSADAFVWLRLYLAGLGRVPAGETLWWTLRRQRTTGKPTRVALTYDALRAVLRRANDLLGTNWTMHDLRHTCALRMIRDENLSLRDVQTVLGHANLTTTQIYLVADEREVIARVRRHLAEREVRAAAAPPPVPPGPGYDPADLGVLFGVSGR
jgi:integrase/recombinase XerD